MGLRINEGINLTALQEQYKIKLNFSKLNYFKDSKFISIKNNNLRLLSKGKLVLNKIVHELLV